MKSTRRKFLTTTVACMTTIFATTAIGQAKEVNVLLFSMPYTQGLKKLAGDFEAKTGVKANIDVVGQDVFESRITLSFTGRTGDLDVVHTPVIQVQKWVAAKWLTPLTDKIAKIQNKDDILKGPLDAYKVNGQMWAVPFFAETGLMAYRKDVLAAAGQKPPETWDDMLKVAKAIKTDQMAAIAMRCAPGQGFNIFVFPMIMRAYGGKFFVNYPDDLTPAINSPENLKALKIYSTLMNDYGPEGIGSFNFPEVAAAVQAGKVAMMVDGTSIVSQVVDPKKSKFADKMAIALPPGGPAGRSPAIAVHGLGVPASAPDPDLSFKFIEWATSAETLTKIALDNPYPDFTRASVAKDQRVIDKYAAIQPDFLKLRVEALNLAVGNYRPLIPTWPAIGAAVGENVNAVVNGLKTPEEGLKAADEEMKAILSKK